MLSVIILSVVAPIFRIVSDNERKQNVLQLLVQVSLDDQLRQEFSRRNGIVAFDSELDAVVESIYGNRKDQVIFLFLLICQSQGSML